MKPSSPSTRSATVARRQQRRNRKAAGVDTLLASPDLENDVDTLPPGLEIMHAPGSSFGCDSMMIEDILHNIERASRGFDFKLDCIQKAACAKEDPEQGPTEIGTFRSHNSENSLHQLGCVLVALRDSYAASPPGMANPILAWCSVQPVGESNATGSAAADAGIESNGTESNAVGSAATGAGVESNGTEINVDAMSTELSYMFEVSAHVGVQTDNGCVTDKREDKKGSAHVWEDGRTGDKSARADDEGTHSQTSQWKLTGVGSSRQWSSPTTSLPLDHSTSQWHGSPKQFGLYNVGGLLVFRRGFMPYCTPPCLQLPPAENGKMQNWTVQRHWH
mmetsp:Transcript_9382/g.17952  ORF Transcript_9382/g.17952 Transcript_9382/m.17952 type:complete len:334 (+) Transcript_9382:189-1190(+)